MRKLYCLIFLIQYLGLTAAPLLLTDENIFKIINKYTKNNEISIYINSQDVENIGYNGPIFLRNGENLVVKNFIHTNDIVIDAGAYVGGWTQSVLNATKSQCTIYAFEPVPDSYKSLEQLRKQSNTLFCFNVALGKEETELKMNYFFQKGSDCSTLFNRPILCNIPVKKITVPVTYLDKFAYEHNIEHINFLKIDTEGAEWDVLLGARNLIENDKIDIIQFEYGGTYPDAHITLFQVYDYLTSHEYLIFRIIPQGLIYIPEWSDTLENFTYSNYLALKQ